MAFWAGLESYMSEAKFCYFLKFAETQILLFESHFQLQTESICLSHYEKGLAKGLFIFNQSEINQLWTEIGLWGLIGRKHPVDLVRTLCGFGASLIMHVGSSYRIPLVKSFNAVTYCTQMSYREHETIQSSLDIHLSGNTGLVVRPFIFMDGKLVFGSFYFEKDIDPDSRFPMFCKLLEQDLCLPRDSVQKVLSRIFHLGFKIIASVDTNDLVLAEKDVVRGIIKGCASEMTLFYVGT